MEYPLCLNHQIPNLDYNLIPNINDIVILSNDKKAKILDLQRDIKYISKNLMSQ